MSKCRNCECEFGELSVGRRCLKCEREWFELQQAPRGGFVPLGEFLSPAEAAAMIPVVARSVPPDHPDLQALREIAGETSQADPDVDFVALAAELRKARKDKRAMLVEFMADKPRASIGDVAKAVHDNRHTRDGTIRENTRQTNLSLKELGSPLSFRVSSGWVFREIEEK